MELTKDIVLGSARYQLSRFSARDGSWIVGQFLPNMTGAWLGEKEVDEKMLGMSLAAAMSLLSEEIFLKVRDKAIAAVKRYDDLNAALPLFHAVTGAPVFELNLVELTALTVASLVFNLHCFFVPGAAQMLLTIFPDKSSLAALGLTGISSPRS